MDDIERQFLDACRTESNPANIAAYHDWLEENGRGVDAEAIRNMMSSAPVKVLEDLKGKVLVAAEVKEEFGNEALCFVLADGQRCRLIHEQD